MGDTVGVRLQSAAGGDGRSGTDGVVVNAFDLLWKTPARPDRRHLASTNAKPVLALGGLDLRTAPRVALKF
jgi:hypothetical protein